MNMAEHNVTSNISELLPGLTVSTDLANVSTSYASHITSTIPLHYRIFQVNPNWSDVRENLKWAWPLHSYGFASSFLLLSSYTFISILTLRSHLPARPFVSTINIFVLLLGLSRCVCLFADPYHSAQIMPIFVGTILWQLGYPCLLSAFGLTQLAFNSSTKLRIGLEWFRSQLHISTAAAAHFSMILVCCILPTFQIDSGVLFHVTQSLFVFWGLILCSTFLYSGWRFLHKRKNRPLICSSKSPTERCQQTDDSSRSTASSKIFLKPQSTSYNFHRQASNSSASAPKIKITDEFDHTLSYTSESPTASLHCGSSALSRSQGNVKINTIDSRPSKEPQSRRYSFEEQTTHSDKNLPRRHSSSSVSSSKRRLSSSDISISHVQKLEQVVILPKSRKIVDRKVSSDNVSSCISEFEIADKMDRAIFDARLIRSGHIDKLLRKIVVSAAFGVLINILQSCLLYGPFGIIKGQQTQPVLPWFIFTSVFRFLELTLGYTIASVARQPLPRSRKHEQDNLFSGSLLIGMLEPNQQ